MHCQKCGKSLSGYVIHCRGGITVCYGCCKECEHQRGYKEISIPVCTSESKEKGFKDD